ncbi:hypothetical protein DTL42_18640 [Bremerella cremea]|uniref:Uncharacterized protein n=1 Tax=Bremerella cremea TaxID=1031537 RepID=A0A368KMS3_9BACT|nr:hypothetical protein [Bremerella cremea]RCS44002.1 hypothetical protein DTL42_18640 [Bremerella cremea]
MTFSPPTSLSSEERNDYLERREQERQFRGDNFASRSQPQPSPDNRRKISAWLQGGLRQHIQHQGD